MLDFILISMSRILVDNSLKQSIMKKEITVILFFTIWFNQIVKFRKFSLESRKLWKELASKLFYSLIFSPSVSNKFSVMI